MVFGIYPTLCLNLFIIKVIPFYIITVSHGLEQWGCS